MRIIANERDYYDGYMNYERKDRFNKVWVRQRREIWLNKNRLKEFEDRSLRINRDGWNTGYLIIAGVVTPYVVWSNHGYPYDKKPIYFYNAESADKFYRTQKKPTATGYWRHRYWGWEKSIKRDLVAFFAGYSDRTDLCILRETPILLITPESNDYGDRYSAVRICYADVNLKEMGLSKVFNAPTMYQTLDLFVSNVLVNDDMPDTTPMTEKQKMGQHGFDPKYGFKTRKRK